MKAFPQTKTLNWASIVVKILAVLPFIPSAAMKFMMHPEVVKGMEHFGFPTNLILTIGIIEVICVIIYLIPSTTVIGAILLTGYLGGTIVTHLRVGEAVYVNVAIGILVWLALYLRDPRIRSLMPCCKCEKIS